MLLPILPVASVHNFFVFSPLTDSVTMLLVTFKMASVGALFVTFKLTKPVHLAGNPLAKVAAPVLPTIEANPVHVLAFQLPLVLAPIHPEVFAVAVFLSVYKPALVPTAILEGLPALSMLLVVLPGPFVHRARRLFHHRSFPITSVFREFTFVDIPVGTRKLSLPVSHTVLPCAFILRAVSPGHGSMTVAQTTHPIAIVYGTRTLVLVAAVLDPGFPFCALDDRLFGLTVLEVGANMDVIFFSDLVSHSFKLSPYDGLNFDDLRDVLVT